MSKYLQIQIPEACHENWDKMDTAMQGKFCNSCQKNVVDFTLMSDNDLVNFFKKNKGNICGRFTNTQLDTDIPIPAKKIPWLKYFFTITIPAFLFSLKGNGQINTLKGKVACVETDRLTKVGEVTIDTSKTEVSKIVKGQITDEEGQPVSYASVMIKNSKQGVAADDSGKFSINLPYQYSTLVFSAVGHITREIDCSSNSNPNVILSRSMTGAVVSIVGYTFTKKKRFPFLTSLFSNSKPISPNIFSIFPNPITSSSKLNIKWSEKIFSDQSIEIHSVAGNLLQQEIIRINKKINQQSIYLKQLPPGAYVIKITDSKTHKFSSQQFIVQ